VESRWLPGTKAYWILALLFVIALVLKINILEVGAPYITIDDQTAFEGGFLVWFGEAPPQRTYLESWIVGITSLVAYGYAALTQGHALGVDVVSDAYRAYILDPKPFVFTYRVVSLGMDLLTALLVFLLSVKIFEGQKYQRWLAALSTGCYLLSYNTIWCNVVARPDIPATLFSLLGLSLYFRSDAGVKLGYSLMAAAAFGAAAGLKLHAVFFVFLILLDVLRLHGFRAAIRYGIPFGLTAFLFFCIAAGSVLFDPLLYVKLRVLNMKDDESPWLHWGDQFVTMFRGSGWLALILMIFGVIASRASKDWSKSSRLSSLLFIACGWLLLFCSIRQLRAYWMLPALPLFYIAAAYGVAKIRNKSAAISIGVAMLAVLGWQSLSQFNELKAVQYDQLQTWVQKNVSKDSPIYILGFESLFLPKSDAAMLAQRLGLHRKIEEALKNGDPYTMRHIQMWEEEAALHLQDLLGSRPLAGFTYYSYFGTPLAEYSGIVEFKDMQYVMLQEHFDLSTEPSLAIELKHSFELVASQLVGPGGGKNGLRYEVYKRKQAGG